MITNKNVKKKGDGCEKKGDGGKPDFPPSPFFLQGCRGRY